MSKKIQGVVASRSGDKTITVLVSRAKIHPLYKKRYNRTAKYAVHDPENQAQVGQKVSLVESRPISRRKRWLLAEIIDQKTTKAPKEAKTKEAKSNSS